MTPPNVPLVDLLRKACVEEADFLRESLQCLLQQLVEAQVTASIGAERYERTPNRTNARNGDRERDWETRVGTIHLEIPKLRKRLLCPGFFGATPAE
ncbi:MAG: transposase [Firmicutes bacterium]|nr:transposase [Bacillota bacterium]